MIQHIYASAANVPFTPRELSLLLTAARVRNRQRDVTGMLLYDNQSFLQVLEGPEQAVDFILDFIHKDTRHTRIRTLMRTPIRNRDFHSWAMAADRGSPSIFPPRNYSNYECALPALSAAPTDAQRFLHCFRLGLYRET